MTVIAQAPPREDVEQPLVPTPPGGRRRRWLAAESLVPLIVLGVFVAVPVVLVFLNSFNTSRPGSPASYGLSNWLQGLDDPRLVESIWNTVRLGLTRTSIALVIALVISWLLARTDMPWARQLEFLFWLAFFVPPLPLTLGWIGLLDPNYGIANEVLRALPLVPESSSGPLNIYGFWGIVWVHLTAMTVPFMVIIFTPTFRRMNAEMEDAALMCGAGKFSTAVRITLPLMLPAVLGGIMLSFIRALQAFEVELLLGSPVGLDVFSTQIYTYIRLQPPEYGVATALGASFMVIMFVLALLYRRVLRGRDFTTVGARAFSSRLVRLGRVGRWVAFAGVSAFLSVAFFLPLGFMVVGSFMRRFGWFDLADPYTTEHWTRLLSDPAFARAVTVTAWFGISAAVVGVAVYWWVAHVAVRSRARASGVVDVLAWVPVAVPGILLALGFLWLYLGTPLRSVLYGSITGLVIALVVGHLATGSVQMRSALLQIGREQEEAAAVCGAGRVVRYRSILLPLLSPALVAAALMTFASAARDISTVVLLATQGTVPISLLMLELSIEGRMEEAAALGLVITLVLGVVTLAVRFLGARAYTTAD
jgi:iron(III) transport system permease protein